MTRQMPQTPAEKFLVDNLESIIKMNAQFTDAPRILNIGAGQSYSIERQLSQTGCQYIADRADIDNCAVSFPSIGRCYSGCSVEDMAPVNSGHYKAAFANYVLEHVGNMPKAVQEINRILVPGGIFIAAIPNPTAPEFIVSKHSPLWFHRMVRGGHGWETAYAYKNIGDLLELFRKNGFQILKVKHWSFIEQYLYKHATLAFLGKIYDKLISVCRATPLMGNVCVVVKKNIK